MTIAPVLTIAGSDSSGGAGVQADLKTMTMLGCFGMSAITALTAQNTLGVQGICPVPAEFLKQQIAAVCEDIPPAAVKVGMVYDTPQILAIAEAVAQYQLPHVVVDPVMVATSGPAAETAGTAGVDGTVVSAGGTADSQSAGSRTADRNKHHFAAANGAGSPTAVRNLSHCRAAERRTQHGQLQRPALCGGHCHVVFRTADGCPKHSRYRLHPVLGDCIFSGTGGFAGRKCPPRKGVYQRCHCGRLVAGTRTRTDCT